MTTYDCTKCGEPYEVGPGGDPFTSVSVTFHDDDREDFAVAACQDCADDFLAELYDAFPEHDPR